MTHTDFKSRAHHLLIQWWDKGTQTYQPTLKSLMALQAVAYKEGVLKRKVVLPRASAHDGVGE